MCAYFLALYSVPLIYVSVFVPASYYFEYYRFIVQSEVMDYDISSSVPLSHPPPHGYSVFQAKKDVIQRSYV